MMKKKNPAPLTGADPYGSFMASLPKQAAVLECKGSRYHGQKSISVKYAFAGKAHYASCSFGIVNVEGGLL
jgi:hypothetical protein